MKYKLTRVQTGWIRWFAIGLASFLAVVVLVPRCWSNGRRLPNRFPDGLLLRDSPRSKGPRSLSRFPCS
ncbi:hypothetical protein LJK88_00415 [Paenibacillus sp. P26]|nr:hypothetical protein LJK88_00415 [Paenibacillus sp. P26]